MFLILFVAIVHKLIPKFISSALHIGFVFMPHLMNYIPFKEQKYNIA